MLPDSWCHTARLLQLAFVASVMVNGIQPLQRLMNAAARVIMNLSMRDHVKQALKELHWLLFEQRITYKLCLLIHMVRNGRNRNM